MNINITGASGFVGKNLTEYFKKNTSHKIVALNLRRGVPKKISDVGAIIHLAGKAHDLKKTSDDSEYFKINFDLTKRIYSKFIEDKNTKIFVFISSVKAVTDKIEGYLNEQTIQNPVTAYGRSKLKAEEFIVNNLPEDKTVVILRPCMIHGPSNKGNLTLLYSIVKKGIPWPLGKFDNSRSFLSIENLCYVINAIIEGKIESGIYHVADDKPLSTSELVAMISELSGKKPKIWNVPKLFIKFIAKLGNNLPLPINEERLEKLTENYLVSNKKLKASLGIEKMPIETKEGMIKTLKSFQ